MWREQPSRVAHHVAQLLFVTCIDHVIDRLVSDRRFVGMTIATAYHDHVTADARAFELNNRAADNGHVAFHRSLDYDVTPDGYCAFLQRAGDLDGSSKTIDVAIGNALNHERRPLARLQVPVRLPAGHHYHQQPRREPRGHF